MGSRNQIPRGGSMMRLAAALLAVITIGLAAPALADGAYGTRGFAVPTPDAPAYVQEPAALWDSVDPLLQRDLERAMHHLDLDEALAKGHLGVALVDVTDVARPRVAAINGDEAFYAASLPKIAVMLAVYEKAYAGQLRLDSETQRQLNRMIRESNNEDSTALMHKVGKRYIAQLLASPRYRLYDPHHNGGLWAGKDYGKGGVWQRDPMHNLSHAASAMQVARFYYLLQTGRLVSPEASAQMKAILGRTAINHKFVKGLHVVRPQAAIYRKSGTWQGFHADGALVERRDGASYIAVGLAASPQATATSVDTGPPLQRPWWRFW
jgi:beta-lactamase class A